jgi:hypothetical protein
MLRLMSVCAAVFLGLLLSGCETMTPSECQTANWSDVGLRDGLHGETLSILDDRVRDCAKAGTSVDAARYLAGREQGLQDYCRLEKAAPLGVSGQGYAGVCPPQWDAEFRRRHQVGYDVYQLRNKVRDLDGRSDRLQHRLRDADRDEDKELKAADKDDDRKRIRKDYDERRRRLREELKDIDRSLLRTRDDLRAAEYTLDMLR